jgi:competence protein ComEC
MTGIYFLSRYSGRKNDAKQSLAVAIAVLLLINPFQAFEAGFILSVLATAGLIYLAGPIAERIRAPKIVRELISIPVAATLACSPYLAMLTGSINLGIIVLNIAVAPIVPVLTILTFLATLTVLPLPAISLILLIWEVNG